MPTEIYDEDEMTKPTPVPTPSQPVEIDRLKGPTKYDEELTRRRAGHIREVASLMNGPEGMRGLFAACNAWEQVHGTAAMLKELGDLLHPREFGDDFEAWQRACRKAGCAPGSYGVLQPAIG